MGTASATPAFGRHLSAHLVENFHRYYLIDCGEATQFQLNRYKIRLRRLDAIFITHMHGDHVLGLPGLLNTLNLAGRTDDLVLVGPGALLDFLQCQFKHTHTELGFQLVFRNWEDYTPQTPVYETDALQVTPLPLRHRMPCKGFLFQQKPKPPRFLAKVAEELGVQRQHYKLLKQGNPVQNLRGELIQPEQVLGERPPSGSYAYCSDTDYLPQLAEYVQGVGLLYHEATFLQQHADRARETQHSTAAEAAEIARLAGVQRLLLGHFSARYRDLEPVLQEARAVFPATQLATEGETYTICE